MSNNVINLARARKSRARAEKAAKGTQNALKFGRTKHQRALERARNEKAEANLDGHKTQSPTSEPEPPKPDPSKP